MAGELTLGVLATGGLATGTGARPWGAAVGAGAATALSFQGWSGGLIPSSCIYMPPYSIPEMLEHPVAWELLVV